MRKSFGIPSSLQSEREDALSSSVKKLRSELATTKKALDANRKAIGTLTEEKRIVEAKAASSLSALSKLESKVSVGISSTSVAKKNTELRRTIVAFENDLIEANRKFDRQEDELVRAASEISVLARALEIRQRDFEVVGSSSSAAGSASSNNSREDRYHSSSSSSNKKKSNNSTSTVREGVLYQLAFVKQEAHSLALEIAERSAQRKIDSREIQRLLNAAHEQKQALLSTDAHVTHLTEQLIAQDSAMEGVCDDRARGEVEMENLVSYVESVCEQNATLERRLGAYDKAMKELSVAKDGFEVEMQSEMLTLVHEIERLKDDGKQRGAVQGVTEERLRVEMSARKGLEVAKDEAREQMEKDASMREEWGKMKSLWERERKEKVEAVDKNAELESEVSRLRRIVVNKTKEVSARY
jgi:hypothetical protein